MLPRIEIYQKTVFTCELLLPISINIENLKKWLTAGKAIEISFSEMLEGSEKFWTVRFCTEDEILVRKLQVRCKELALDTLKQKEEKTTKLGQKIKKLDKQLQASQDTESSQAKFIGLLQDEIQKMRWEISRLQEIESQHKSLSKTFRIQSDRLTLLEKQASRSEINQAKTELQSNNTVQRVATRIPVDVCIVCGKTAMPSQGICLDCSR